nr:RNA-directed DNA polymerase, eukaryota [Tanacetum cinerariifolium]
SAALDLRNGECIVMGDFNEVRRKEDRWGSVFNVYGARAFNHFIASAGLVEIQLEGYNFTWTHPSASKISKLDRFLVSDGLLSVFPYLSVGFDLMVTQTWNDIALTDNNGMIRFKKKLQILKKEMRTWIADRKVNDDLLASRMGLMNQLHDFKSSENRDCIQKAKVKWAVEGDENSKFFHGIVNRKRANLTVKGVLIDGGWVYDPNRVKDEFQAHFATRFNDPSPRLSYINFTFPNRLNDDQVADLENSISRDEIRSAVWGWGEDKSPGPYGLSLVISDLVSDVQTAFLPNREILDGPFIINELIARCHHKKQQAMIFKVDFAKAYDSVRWDYLDAILNSFGFGSKWRSWIRGSLHSSMASILVNGSPTSEFQFYRGLKQGDPLAPYLFILVMESLHLSFSRVVEEGTFTGIKIDSSITLSHLFYADDAIFIGKWSQGNLNCIAHMLRCFSLLSGLSINLQKIQLLGVGVPDSNVIKAASLIGCSILRTPFKYLGTVVGGNM